MKKVKIIFSLVLILLILTSSLSLTAFAQGENLISNSSFESNGGFQTGSLYISSDKAHSGGKALKSSARGVTVLVSSYGNIPVKPQTDYLYSAYIYRADNSSWAYIDMNDSAGELQLLNTEIVGEWFKVEGIWNSNQNTSVNPRIVVEPNYTVNQHLGAGLTGDIWFDDISLTEVVREDYSETPPTLSSDATYLTTENSDLYVTVVSDKNREILKNLKSKETGTDFAGNGTYVALPESINGEKISWLSTNTSVKNMPTLSSTGKDSFNLINLTYKAEGKDLTLNSYYRLYDTGPLYHYFEITNNTGKPLSFSQAELVSADMILSTPYTGFTLYRFNRSRFNNGFDGSFTKGIFTDKIGTNTYLKTTVENSWLKNSGELPFNIIHSGTEGFYTGYEWSYGELSLRTQQNPQKIRFEASLGSVSDTIELKSGDTLTVPPTFIGAFKGSVDEGANQMKAWFYNHLMTETLRENENEPKIELHLPLFSEQDLKGYLYDCNLSDWGVELTKMDYWWTVESNSAFDASLEQQWNPYPSKWPNGMTYGKLVKEKFPEIDTSLYMCDTYMGVDIGTKEGQEAQLAALKERLKNWEIDYWRSDFDLLKPNSYANHQGLMYILDSLIAWNKDFRYEHCSAGGSLKDFSTLQRMTFMTMEDSGGALNHRMAFYSNSYMINPVQLKFDMGFDWSSQEDSNLINQNRKEWNIYNVRTAMMGAMMVQNVSNRLNNDELSALKEGWKLYKEQQRPILKGADVYHILPMPTGSTIDGMEFYNKALEKGSVFIFRDKSGATSQNIKLQGLEENASYKLTFEDRENLNCTKQGSELMSTGINVTGLSSAYDSEIIWIEKVSSTPTAPTTAFEETSAPELPTETTPIEYYVLGDATLSGEVDIKDATAVQKFAANMMSFSEKAELSANADQNEEINIRDASTIQKYLAGVKISNPVGEKFYYSGGEIIPPVTVPTEPTEATTTPETVLESGYTYVLNEAGWNTVYCHYWNNGGSESSSWPGVQMEKISDNLYRFKLPTDSTGNTFRNVVFNANSSPQTQDLVVEDFKVFNNRTSSWETLN